MNLLAQISFGSLSIAQIAIAIIVVAAICAVVFIALRQMGVAIPSFVIQIFWVLVCAVVCVLAVKFLIGIF